MVVGLGLSLVPAWWRWFNGPTWVDGERQRAAEAGHLRGGHEGTINGDDLRIRLTNKPGHREAANLRVQLRPCGRLSRWRSSRCQQGSLQIDVTPLRWSSRRNDDATAQQVTVLAGGSFDYVTFVHWDNRRRPGHRRRSKC